MSESYGYKDEGQGTVIITDSTASEMDSHHTFRKMCDPGWKSQPIQRPWKTVKCLAITSAIPWSLSKQSPKTSKKKQKLCWVDWLFFLVPSVLVTHSNQRSSTKLWWQLLQRTKWCGFYWRAFLWRLTMVPDSYVSYSYNLSRYLGHISNT